MIVYSMNKINGYEIVALYYAIAEPPKEQEQYLQSLETESPGSRGERVMSDNGFSL